MTTEQLASIINQQVEKRGTIFVSFRYKDKQRNITVGADIKKAFAKREHILKNAGVVWGETFGKRKCIQRHQNGKLYLRGFENITGLSNNGHGFKCYDLAKMTDVKVGGVKI